MMCWTEIRNDYYNDDEGCYVIDAWKTDDDNEEGEVIALVYPERVVYIDNLAREDAMAEELILECKELLKQNDLCSHLLQGIKNNAKAPSVVRFNMLLNLSEHLLLGKNRSDKFIEDQLALIQNYK